MDGRTGGTGTSGRERPLAASLTLAVYLPVFEREHIGSLAFFSAGSGTV